MRPAVTVVPERSPMTMISSPTAKSEAFWVCPGAPYAVDDDVSTVSVAPRAVVRVQVLPSILATLPRTTPLAIGPSS